MTNTAEPIKYDPAFAEADANIVLQSSDSICYRIPSFVLRTTSGFFRDMMTLPQPDNPRRHEDDNDDSIILNETSKVLGVLLRMISGLEIPKWESIDEIDEVLAAAQKYDMPGPMTSIRSAMRISVLLKEPLKMYAISARHEWEAEAKEASNHSLCLSIHDPEYTSVLGRVPSPYLLRLIALHRMRRDTLQKYIDSTPEHHHHSLCPDYQKKNQPWEDLKVRVFKEMDRRPMGDTLFGGGVNDPWPEATTCFTYKCDNRYCGNRPFSSSMFKCWLDSIPSTI